jgi:hypothetical protein
MRGYKVFALLFMLLLPDITALAQEITLTGYLGVEGGESYTYKLVFTKTGNHIQGYSYTWLNENRDVKAAIQGEINNSERSLNFKETEIIHNHGFQSGATICLINAVLKFVKQDGSSVFAGRITSSDISNVYCGQGTISFTDNETIRKLFQTDESKVTKPIPSAPKSSKPVRIVYDTASVPARPSKIATQQDEIEKITEGVLKELQWETDTVMMSIWDGSIIDGDIISLSLNDATIIKNYKLQSRKKVINYPIKKGELLVLEITAENEGNESPNTANLVLTDGKKEHSFLVYNKVARKSLLRIRRK